jgi:hypothetical protein
MMIDLIKHLHNFGGKHKAIHITTSDGSNVQAKVTSLSSTGAVFADSAFQIYDNLNATKLFQFQASGISTSTTRTLTVPNENGTLLLGTGASGYYSEFTSANTVTGIEKNTAFNVDFENTTSNIKEDGVASIGALSTVARADHIHPKVLSTEDDIYFSDVTTLNSSTGQHGLLPRLSGNAGQYLNGGGSWATPSSGTANDYSSTTFDSETTVAVVHNFGIYPVIQIISSTGVVQVIDGSTISVTHNSLDDFTVSFSPAASGTILATVGSPSMQSIKTITDNYGALSTDRVLHVTASGKTISLYASSTGLTGKELVIDNASSGDITVTPNGSEKIQNETSQTIPPESSLRIYNLGSSTGWRIY